MPLSTVVPYTIFALVFSYFLFLFGRELLMTKSMKAALEEYEKNPGSRSFMKKWFWGWFLGFERTTVRWSINALGDRFVSLFYRLAGLFFLIFAVALLVSAGFFWYQFSIL